MMAQGIEAFSFAKIFNCSDGVQIPGTTPRLPGSIRLDAPANRKPILLARAKRELTQKAKGEMIPAEQLCRARAAFADFYGRMIATIDEAAATEMPFIEFYERMAPFFQERGEDPFQIVLRSVNIGTLMMSFQMAYYFVRRVPEAEQSAVMAVYLRALRERLEVMRGCVDQVFAQFEETRINLALWKPATQSSTIKEHSKSSDPSDDAQSAVSGVISTSSSLITSLEQNPWWQVDLEEIFKILEIRLFNNLVHRERLRHFTVLAAVNPGEWRQAFVKDDDEDFGGPDGKPLVIAFAPLLSARYLQIRLDGMDYLSFAQIKVYGP